MEIKRCYDTLIGASVAENQLCNGESVTVPNGRKYYLKKSGVESLGESAGSAITGLTSGSDMVIDLTQMLGSSIADYIYSLESATAGSGISKLREWGFLRGYQAFNSGSLESVEVTEKKCVGFNQWDEEWEVGGISDSTGQNADGSYRIRSKNYIPVIPGGSYYYRESASYYIYMRYYDANKNFMKASSGHITNTIDVIPDNVHFVRFMVYKNGWTDYENHGDICINLSSDRNGEYEPYTTISYPLGTDTLRGIFKLDANNNLYADGDRKESDGTITRKYKKIIVNAFTGAWGATNNGYSVYLSLNDWKNSRVYANAISDKFVFSPNTYSTMPVMTFVGGSGASGTVSFILPSTVTTLAEANDWARQNPFTIVYELATPTTEQSTSFTSPQIVYPDGTEEFVTENGVPVGHETKYQL